MKRNVCRVGLALGAVLVCCGALHAAQINEIRIDQPGTDNDEYVEISGSPGESLNGLTYIVIGDGAGGSGTIENVTSLDGLNLMADGLLAIKDSTTVGAEECSGYDINTLGLNFENSDNVTHMIVSGFSGALNDDLDTDDDGTLDVTPWTSIVDCVALIETVGSGDQVYCATQVGPDGTFVPGHVLRCGSSFLIGDFTACVDDTPGEDNGCGSLAPDVFNLIYRPCAPEAAEQVTVTVNVTDQNDDVDVVKVFYKLQAAANFDSLTMSAANDSTYEANLPGQADQSIVQFYVTATDLQGNSTSNPTSAPAFTRTYRVGIQSLASIQSNTVADSCLSSALANEPVNVVGIVTHEAFEYSDDFFYIQSGTGPNSGMKIFAPDSGFVPDIGDSVIVSGFVTEFRCVTEVSIFFGCGEILGTGNVLARTLSSVTDIENEVNESMLVTLAGPIDVATGFDSTDAGSFIAVEFLVGNPPNTAWVGDDTFFPDGIGYTIVPDPSMVLDNLTGIVGTRLSTETDSTTMLRLEPRRDNDVDVNFTDVPGEDELDVILAPRLGQNFPNPFNPVTTIEFEIPNPGTVHIAVYDGAGRLVKRLLTKQYFSAGRDRVVWNGTDNFGKPVPSGVYFYRLDANNFSATRKMLLLK